MEILIFQLIVLIFSVIIHEVAHGWMADYLGDPTAKLAGRLTLNPLKHLEWFGSFLLPLFLFLIHSPFIFGWAKPVPYNPNLLVKDYKYGPLKVALAGPFTNLGVALIFGLILRFSSGILPATTVWLLSFVIFLNILLAVFNLIPLPPLDGSKILTLILPSEYSLAWQSIGMSGIFFVILLIYFFSGFIFKTVSLLFELVVGSPPIF